MVQAYSRLRRVLNDQNLTVPELHRCIQQHGFQINLKSLYRLSKDQQPLYRLDLGVAAAICQVFEMQLSDLIVFEKPAGKLRRLPTVKQRRLDILMAENNEGQLGHTEQQELQALVRLAEEIMLDNARTLARQRQQLLTR